MGCSALPCANHFQNVAKFSCKGTAQSTLRDCQFVILLEASTPPSTYCLSQFFCVIHILRFIFHHSFLPVISTILGAIPLMGTYWAALPGVLELWCVRGSYWQALLLMFLHLLPWYFMDTALYAEIKGWEPLFYLLAILTSNCLYSSCDLANCQLDYTLGAQILFTRLDIFFLLRSVTLVAHSSSSRQLATR